MKYFLIILLLFLPLSLFPKVFYLNNGDSVPSGTVSAVETRVKLSTARRGKLAHWVLNWGDDSLMVRFNSRNVVDGIDEPDLTISCCGQTESAPGLNSNGGWNSVAVEWTSDSTARVMAGAERLGHVMNLSSLNRPNGTTLCVSAPSGKLTVADLIVETDDNDLSRLMVNCVPETFEVWKYLDSTDAASARLGGAYRLGLMPTADGYDLIYLGGARVNSSSWRQGMRKASLTSTAYQGHYLLQWIDATGRTLPGEHYATLNTREKTLTLDFPAFPLTLRFVRE
ncbi:MAG: hypothetical protein K2F96_04945 [Muribaculaceae bacterium]|nr:hypothetical protein [Muribaculaceae bacterium]